MTQPNIPYNTSYRPVIRDPQTPELSAPGCPRLIESYSPARIVQVDPAKIDKGNILTFWDEVIASWQNR